MSDHPETIGPNFEALRVENTHELTKFMEHLAGDPEPQMYFRNLLAKELRAQDRNMGRKESIKRAQAIVDSISSRLFGQLEFPPDYTFKHLKRPRLLDRAIEWFCEASYVKADREAEAFWARVYAQSEPGQ